MLKSVNWKQFKVSDILGTATLGKYHNPQTLEYDKNGYPYICASNSSNGINSKMSRVNGDKLSLTPTKVIAWGKQCPMFTYHDEPCVTAQGMYYYDVSGLTERVSFFLAAALQHVSDAVGFNYGNCLIGSKADELMFQLPVTPSGEPDWDFMEQFMAELDEERMAELDAYLKVTGLEDCELTEEDEKVLATEPEMKDFRIGELFEKCNLKRLKKDFDKARDISKEKTEEFNIPLINAKHGDNGIMYYGRKEDWETTSLAIDIVNDGAISTGDVYPQPDETGVLYNAYLIQSKKPITDEKLLSYLAACIEKSIKGKFGYDRKASWDRVAEEYIKLPVISDGTPDFEYMEKFMHAVDKLLVKDVVEWKDREIEETRKIVKGE